MGRDIENTARGDRFLVRHRLKIAVAEFERKVNGLFLLRGETGNRHETCEHGRRHHCGEQFLEYFHDLLLSDPFRSQSQ